MARKSKTPWTEIPDVIGREEPYPAYLRGLSHTQLSKPRGLRGSTFGPANRGRHLSEAERKTVEIELRKRGDI